MFKTTDINCPCGNTKGFEHSQNLAECTSCTTVVHVDTPTYHTYQVTSLDEIEQQAKEQALEDMHMALLFNGNAEIPTFLDDVDWHTCFDTNNIIVNA